MEDLKWVGGILAAVVVAVLAISLVVRQFSHHYDVVNCREFGARSGHQVEFVDYTFWSWDCLALTSTGEWLPVDQLRDFGDGR